MWAEYHQLEAQLVDPNPFSMSTDDANCRNLLGWRHPEQELSTRLRRCHVNMCFAGWRPGSETLDAEIRPRKVWRLIHDIVRRKRSLYNWIQYGWNHATRGSWAIREYGLVRSGLLQVEWRGDHFKEQLGHALCLRRLDCLCSLQNQSNTYLA